MKSWIRISLFLVLAFTSKLAFAVDPTPNDGDPNSEPLPVQGGLTITPFCPSGVCGKNAHPGPLGAQTNPNTTTIYNPVAPKEGTQ